MAPVVLLLINFCLDVYIMVFNYLYALVKLALIGWMFGISQGSEFTLSLLLCLVKLLLSSTTSGDAAPVKTAWLIDWLVFNANFSEKQYKNHSQTLLYPLVCIQSNIPMWSPQLSSHLYLKVTISCLVIENFIWIESLLRGHLSYKATFSLTQMWPLNTGLTVYVVWFTKFSRIFELSMIMNGIIF